MENFSGEGADYAFDLVPTRVGTITVDIDAGQAKDRFGNGNIAAKRLSITYDAVAPTVTIASEVQSPANIGRIPVTVTFSEEVVTFGTANMSVTGAQVEGLSGSGRGYSFDLIPEADRKGSIRVMIAEGAVSDHAGNGNRNAAEFSIDYDISAPTVTITTSASPQDSLGRIPVLVSFSEEVEGFDQTDLQVSGASVEQFTGIGSEYNFDLVASGESIVTVDIAEDVAHDRAGNGNLSASQFTYSYDTTRPSVTLSGTPDFPGTPYRLAIAFSEPVTKLALADFKVVNADISSLSGTGADYSLQVIARTFAHSIRLRENAAVDSAGNGNTASNLFANRPDGSGPKPRLTGLPASFLPGDRFDIIFDFGEAVSGFTIGDVMVANGTVAALTGGPRRYRAAVMADGKGNLSVALAKGAARDKTGQASMAAIAWARIESEIITGKAITGFLAARARDLVQQQPDLVELLRQRRHRSRRRRFDLDALFRDDREYLSFVAENDRAVWMKMSARRTRKGKKANTSYVHSVIGNHIVLNDDLLAGVMLQMDNSGMTTSDGVAIGGGGLLVGSYVVGKLADHRLYYQGSILYGKTWNHVTPLGTFTDRFTGKRKFVSLGVEGDYAVDVLTLRPSLSVSHVHESQHAYADGLSNLVPARSVSMTEIELDLGAESPVWPDNDNWIHSAGIAGIWAKHEGSGAAPLDLQREGGRLRIGGGLRYDGDNGLTGSFKASVDGLGSGSITYGLGADFIFRF
ncbi:Ig-like domain-containing protein [Paracoccus methylarcula]|uniref:Autotransporter outer membrane beta-barrel domain-containing protein n=1 Tax=Paracoccus methylarcula TaxID=72022 RepID=A0A3R7P556_9RHOB|nr:Ig-like domain-containing protein [Paracoccus methylarcula]RNF35021.1 autotransporter outer membrane beta-barrel domain-containing protein [Paracoccus methylarcula]